MVGSEWIDVKAVKEEDGTLIVMEENGPIPFETKRVFLIKDVAKGCSRGDHATKKTRLILFPIVGSCTVIVDDGEKKEAHELNDPTRGLLVEPMIWRSMQNFSEGCVLMALCDRCFEPGNETYGDYTEFLCAVAKGKEAEK